MWLQSTKGTLFLTATHVIFIDAKTQAEIFVRLPTRTTIHSALDAARAHPTASDPSPPAYTAHRYPLGVQDGSPHC